MRFQGKRFTGLGSAVLLASAMAVAAPSVAHAQRRHGGHVHDAGGRRHHQSDYLRSRVELGGGLGAVVPQGEFGRLVGNGFGANLHAVVGLEPTNTFGLRFDAGYVNYGSERFTIPVFAGTGRVGANLHTRNNIATFGIGPQLQLPVGPVRPYVNGFVGGGYFFTESSVSDGFSDFGRTLNFDDLALGYGLGGGLNLQLGGGTLLLNLDTQYRKHDNVQYLREGSIVDDGFGGAIVTPILSDADFLTFQVGVSIGL